MAICYADILRGGCGVSVLYDFCERSNGITVDPTEDVLPGGAGFITAGFIYGNELSNDMFDSLSSRYDVLFVSPVRLNRNSQNQFYFAVFSVKDVENDKYGWDDQDEEENGDDD